MDSHNICFQSKEDEDGTCRGTKTAVEREGVSEPLLDGWGQSNARFLLHKCSQGLLSFDHLKWWWAREERIREIFLPLFLQRFRNPLTDHSALTVLQEILYCEWDKRPDWIWSFFYLLFYSVHMALFCFYNIKPLKLEKEKRAGREGGVGLIITHW